MWVSTRTCSLPRIKANDNELKLMEAAVIAALSDYFRRELISGSRGRVGVGVKTKKRSKPTTTDDPDDFILDHIMLCASALQF